MMKNKKNPGTDPNDWLPAEVAQSFEVVDWHFGPLVHFPAMRHLGHPNGRVNLKDITPAYAEQLVKAGFKHLRRKPEPVPVEAAAEEPKERKPKERK